MARRAGLAATLVAAAALAAGFGSSGAGQPTAASIRQALDRVEAHYASQLVGMCVGAVDGKVSVIRCYGTRVNGKHLPPNAGTLFLIDSVSKTFPATLLALRIQQHSIPGGVEAPVKGLAPAVDGGNLFPPTLTLLELADHYSGLPKKSVQSPNVALFLTMTAACLNSASCRLDTPGGTYSYSNWGVAALGQILALHDGFADGPLGPWEPDNLKSVTKPLGMTRTKTWLDWQASDPLYYQANRAIASGSDHWYAQPYSDPAGGLYSTPRDMLTWLRYSMGLAGPADLAAARHWLFEEPTLLRSRGSASKKIGLVWNVDTGTGATCVWKTGDGLGYHAYVLFVEHAKRGLFLLVNNAPTTSYHTIGKALLNALPTTPGAGSPTC